MRVCVDNREKKRVVAALEYFSKYKPKVKTLLYGDYVFSNDETTVVFEYKTVEDYLNSINDNRVFNEALDQSNHFNYHFVIIVGREKEWQTCKDKLYYSAGLQITDKTINGSLASLVEFTSVLQVKTEQLAFDLMERIATKCLRDQPVVHRYPKSRGSPAYRFLVNNVKGVNHKIATKICEDLDLQSIMDVLSLDLETLTTVTGIGQKKARNILGQISRGFPLD